MKKLPSLSIVFPAFNDEHTIAPLVKDANRLALPLADVHEIIVVNDASEDNTVTLLKALQKEIGVLRVVTHKNNRGYGGALISGFNKAKHAFIFYTDSDGQYDVGELPKLIAAMDDATDMVTGFKIARADPWYRKIMGNTYNYCMKKLLRLRVRDIDCDFRLFRKSILDNLILIVESSIFDAQFLKEIEVRGARIKEVPIHHYPRRFGHSQVLRFSHMVKSLSDLGKIVSRRYI